MGITPNRTCNYSYRSFTYDAGKSPLRPSTSPVHLGYDDEYLGSEIDNFGHAHQSDEDCSVTSTLSPARKCRSLASFKMSAGRSKSHESATRNSKIRKGKKEDAPRSYNRTTPLPTPRLPPPVQALAARPLPARAPAQLELRRRDAREAVVSLRISSP